MPVKSYATLPGLAVEIDRPVAVYRPTAAMPAVIEAISPPVPPVRVAVAEAAHDAVPEVEEYTAADFTRFVAKTMAFGALLCVAGGVVLYSINGAPSTWSPRDAANAKWLVYASPVLLSIPAFGFWFARKQECAGNDASLWWITKYVGPVMLLGVAWVLSQPWGRP